MKSLKFIIVFAFALATISCSKDDNNNSSYNYNKDNLLGKYKLKSLKSKMVKTIKVDGFDVVTTTTSEGDTFSVSYQFASNNTVTKNGTYRITETKTQNTQTSDTTYIVVLEDKKVDYSVNQDKNELTLNGSTYKVSNFNSTGFKLNLDETTENNGEERKFTKKLEFSKD